jgi:uncharacterized protein YjbI with pentapeptide repeats
VQFFRNTLQQENGVAAWNRWRTKNRYTDPQLYQCDLSGTDLTGIDLSRAYLYEAKFRNADLRWANLSGAHLRLADLRGADLRDARMLGAALHETKLQGAQLDGARVHGISAWRIETDQKTTQRGLIITLDDETNIKVDDLEIAQFMYLLLNNQKIRDVINTITSSAVLILGRFGERKSNLEAIRDALRDRGYLPILFDFDVPEDRDVTETVRTLAGLARFIIADLTDPASIPKELEAIVPGHAVPVRPIIEGEERPYSMFDDYWKYFWVIPDPFRYRDHEHLIDSLDKEVIDVAESMFALIKRRRPDRS